MDETDGSVPCAQLPPPWAGLDWKPLQVRRNDSKSHVFWAQEGDRKVVCKDSAEVMGWSPKGQVRRWTLANEVAALRALDGIPGIPRLLGAGATWLVLEHARGERLCDLARGHVPDPVFDEIERIIGDVHARQFVVGDVHRRNILVTPEGQVHLVDFELALDRRRWPGRLLGRRMAVLDRLSVARQRRRYGASLGPEHRSLLDAGWPWPYGWLRKLRSLWHDVRGRKASHE